MQVTDVEAAIKGLVAGTLKPEDVHVEGIESEEEKAKKEVRQYIMLTNIHYSFITSYIITERKRRTSFDTPRERT